MALLLLGGTPLRVVPGYDHAESREAEGEPNSGRVINLSFSGAGLAWVCCQVSPFKCYRGLSRRDFVQ